MTHDILTVDFLKNVSELLLTADKKIVVPSLENKRAEIVQKSEGYDGTGDFITSIDSDCEDFLLEKLRQIIPNSFAVGEESFDQEREKNIEAMTHGYAWVIDPLDGTNNVKKYLTEENTPLPRYGIMSALLHNGETVASWVLACNDAEKKMVCSALGLGAFFYDVNTKEMEAFKYPQQKAAEDMMLVTTVKAFPDDYQVIINKNIADGKIKIYDPSPKSAAHEIMMILDGTADAAPFRQFRLWDHLPGMLIVREAGGHVQLMNGEEPILANQRKNCFLYAPSKESWTQIRQNFLGDVFYDHTENPNPKP